jgi:AP-1-like transcription factor
MKEIEAQLADLHERHCELTQSYETLQLEHSATKQELETFRRKYEDNHPTSRSHFPNVSELHAPQAESSDQMFFDFYGMFYESKKEGDQEG